METYAICAKCGCNVLVGHRHKGVVEVFVLCDGCMKAVEKMQDRLDVLEGFVEEVGKMANPITKI